MSKQQILKLTPEQVRKLQYMEVMDSFDQIMTQMQIEDAGFEAKMGKESQRVGPNYREIEKVAFPDEGGVLTFYKDEPYPKKGFAHGQTIEVLDKIKRVSSILIQFVGNYWFVIVLWPPRSRHLLNQFIGSSLNYIRPYLLKEHRYCDCVREFRRVCDEVEIDHRVKDMVSMLLEFDDAYRYRLQFASQFVSSKDSIFKAVHTVFKTLHDRELSKRTKRKWRLGLKLYWLIALVYRKEIRAFLDTAVMERFHFSEEDQYQVGYKKTFDYVV